MEIASARQIGLDTPGPRYRSKLPGELRHDLEQLADEAEVGDLEDRRVVVLVDGDGGLGILLADEVVDGAGVADGDVEFGRDALAGRAALIVVGGALGRAYG